MKKKIKNTSNTANLSLFFTIFIMVVVVLAGLSRAKLSKENVPKKSGADLSYLMIHVDEDVQMIITAPDGSVAHALYNGIERAYFGLELPIDNHLYPEEELGAKYWSFEQKYPESGVYEILLQSDAPEDFNTWLASYDKKGGKYLLNENVSIDKNGTLLLLDNDPLDSSNTSLTVK